MRAYPATLTPDPDSGFTVTFRDVPEAITEGDSREEALLRAEDALESALAPRTGCLLLRCQPEGVDLVTRDAAACGDALGGAELVGHVPGEVVGTRAPRAVDDVRAQAHATHELDTARDPDVDGAGAHQVGDEVVGLLRRAALAVDGGGGHLVGQTRAQPRVAP